MTQLEEALYDLNVIIQNAHRYISHIGYDGYLGLVYHQATVITNRWRAEQIRKEHTQ